MAQHGLAQQHAVGKLLGGDALGGGVFAGLGVAAEVGMALGAEVVEGAAHVEFLLGLHVKEGQVNGGAAGVSALFGNIILSEEHRLVQVGIEVRLHQRVGHILGPAHEVVHGLLRTVGIVDFQPVALFHHVVADGAQAVGGHTGEQGDGGLVAVDAGAHEVVGAEVADFENGIGHGVRQIDKLAVVLRRYLFFFRMGAIVARGGYHGA